MLWFSCELPFCLYLAHFSCSLALENAGLVSVKKRRANLISKSRPDLQISLWSLILMPLIIEQIHFCPSASSVSFCILVLHASLCPCLLGPLPSSASSALSTYKVGSITCYTSVKGPFMDE